MIFGDRACCDEISNGWWPGGRLSAAVVIGITLVGTAVLAAPAPGLTSPAPLSGFRFRQALSQRVSVSWVNTSTDQLRRHTIRYIVRHASKLWRIAIVLDRRVDPSVELDIVVRNQPVGEVVAEIARRIGAATSVTGHTLFLGPAEDVGVLRTLVALRDAELQSLATTPQLTGRRRVLRQRRTIRFEDFSEPRLVLGSIAARWGLTIEGLSRVPHDLWAGAEFPAVTATEALSLVLVQFGLTFTWNQDATAVELVRPPRPVTIAGTWAPRQKKTAKAISLVRRQLPGVKVEATPGGDVRVHGTWEQLRVARSLVQLGRLPTSTSRPSRFLPLSRRQFTLKVTRARLADIMNQLEQTGVRFEYDKKQLADAGIRLERTVAIDVRQVNARVFFKRLFDPVGLDQAIDGRVVRLTPKPPEPR